MLQLFRYNANIVVLLQGGSAFCGFVEAGVGEKGLFCAGLRYKF